MARSSSLRLKMPNISSRSKSRVSTYLAIWVAVAGVTESQVAGVRVQSEEVRRDSLAMAWSERTNGNPRPIA
jgi:hypothetical protein